MRGALTVPSSERRSFGRWMFGRRVSAQGAAQCSAEERLDP